MFKSLSHLEFIFVYGERVYSNLIDLHANVQISQHHLKRWSFSYFIFFPPLLKINHRHMGLFLDSLFCSIDPYGCFVSIPCCFDYCSFVELSEVWEGYASCFVHFLPDCFGNSGSFMVPYKL